jgi:hypothetical protein
MKRRMRSAGSKSIAQHVDGLVQKTSNKFASAIPRRSFIGRLTSGIIVVGGTSLILKPTEAQATFCGITECRGTDTVGVCYTSWKVTNASGIGVYKGPSFSAAPVTDTSGNPIIIPVNAHFGRVSNRYSSSCGDPGPRPSYNGFLWGYWCTGTPRQGWIPYGTGYAAGDSGWVGHCCGPAGADFDCTDPKSDCPSYHGCGGSPAPSGTCSTAHWVIGTSGSDGSHERYYIRYAENSTTYGWLVPGDVVYRYGYAHGSCCTACPSGVWSCVQAVCCAYVPNGCRGWTCSDILDHTTTNNTPCYPGLPCPN